VPARSSKRPMASARLPNHQRLARRGKKDVV
jgi:hypothetical protein